MLLCPVDHRLLGANLDVLIWQTQPTIDITLLVEHLNGLLYGSDVCAQRLVLAVARKVLNQHVERMREAVGLWKPEALQLAVGVVERAFLSEGLRHFTAALERFAIAGVFDGCRAVESRRLQYGVKCAFVAGIFSEPLDLRQRRLTLWDYARCSRARNGPRFI